MPDTTITVRNVTFGWHYYEKMGLTRESALRMLFERALEIARDERERFDLSGIRRSLIHITNEINDGYRTHQILSAREHSAKDQKWAIVAWRAFRKLLRIPTEPEIQLPTGVGFRDVPTKPIPWKDEMMKVRDSLIEILTDYLMKVIENLAEDSDEGWETGVVPAIAQLATERGGIRLRLI